MGAPPPDTPDTAAAILTASDYDGLRRMLAARRRELGLSQIELDDVAGLQDGYTGKLECGVKNFGPLSLGLVLEALGVELAIVPKAA